VERWRRNLFGKISNNSLNTPLFETCPILKMEHLFSHKSSNLSWRRKPYGDWFSLSVSKYRSYWFLIPVRLVTTVSKTACDPLSLLNNFPLYKLLHEELLVPRPLPWWFESSSVEILVPSGDFVLSFVVRSLPSSIQIPPWITYRWDRTLNRFLLKTLLICFGDSLKVLTWIEIDPSLKILIFPSKSRHSCQIPLWSTF
jgi:hypothetical protein